MRLFVAVWPSSEVVTSLQTLPRPPVSGLRWTEPQQWHVTMRFIGEVFDDVVGEVGDALATCAAGLAPAPAVIGPETACFGTSVLVTPVSGLEVLAAATVGATAGWGIPFPERRPFVGHLTLARSRRRGPDLRRLAGQTISGSWMAYELTLVRSFTSSTGARYDILRRFALSS